MKAERKKSIGTPKRPRQSRPVPDAPRTLAQAQSPRKEKHLSRILTSPMFFVGRVRREADSFSACLA
jgi:hypothetical protein